MAGRLALSVVVVAHAMARELPRTIRSLTTPYQQDIDPASYEVLVVDNGSPEPVDPAWFEGSAPSVSLHRLDPAPASPARAANLGLSAARGELVGLVVDGARMASPGLLAGALLAARTSPHPLITAPAWSLDTPQVEDTRAEDELLERIRWEEDGYRLFEVGKPAPSSGRGLFGAMGESSSLFLTAGEWARLGGLDEAFELPGGGLVNHDLYRRACELDGTSLLVLLGEGTFHQSHGGAATSGRVSREAMRADYERVRGVPHRPPRRTPLYVGRTPRSYLPYVRWSVDQARG